MDKFTTEDEKLFDEYPDLVVPCSIYRAFMMAEIDYFNGKYKESLNRLGETLKNVENSGQLNGQIK